MLPKPKGWESNELTKFFEAAYSNTYATFDNEKHWVETLIQLDEMFSEIGTNLRDTKSIFEGMLLVRSHSAFRAAAQLAFQTQIPESFVLMRSSIEYAGYAVLTHSKPDLVELFLRRHESAETLKEHKEAFKIRRVKDAIGQHNKEALRLFNNLYDLTINFGGHPNERGMVQTAQLKKAENETVFFQAQLMGDGLALSHSLKVLIEIAVCSLDLFQIIFKVRYGFLRLDDRLDRIKKNYLTKRGPKLLVPKSYSKTKT